MEQCLVGLALCSGPIPFGYQQLGPVDEALAAIGHKVGLRSAPGVEFASPLHCALEIEHALAGQDHGAIDHPSKNRGHAPRGDCDHRLIKQCDALGNGVVAD